MLDSHPTYLALEVNAALDTGKYDGITVDEVLSHIESMDIIPWLRIKLRDDIDLSLFDSASAAEMHEQLADIKGGYGNQTRRKWGVENRGLCLLVAWSIEVERRKRS